MSEFRSEGNGNEIAELRLRNIIRDFRYGQFVFSARRLLAACHNVRQIPHEQILRRLRQLVSEITFGLRCDATRVKSR